MELQELLIREAVRDTIARYNHAGDRGRFEAMVGCFTTDGVLTVHDDTRHEGRGALIAFFSGVRGTTSGRGELTMLRHCVTNTLIEVNGPDAATARSYFFVLTDIGVDHWGTYHDHLVADPASGRWLFTSRSVRTDGYAAGSFFAP